MTSTRRSTLFVLSPFLYATLIFGILYCYVTLQRVPIWITEQQQQQQQHQHILLLTTTSTKTIIQSDSIEISEQDKSLFDNNKNNHNNNSNNKNNTINETPLCPTRPPIWPNSLIITQRRIPDMDSKVSPAITITYYDYKYGGNLIQIYSEDDNDDMDMNNALWDLELNTGQSYYFTPSKQTCTPIKFSVGILRPDFLQDNATISLGPSFSSRNDNNNNKLVCGYTKANFIDYYIDPITNIPDSWYFHTMKATFQVLNYTTTTTTTTTSTSTSNSSNNNTDNNLFSNNDNQPTTLIDPSLFIPPKYCF